MKKNATPELSAKWWSSNEPDGLSSSKDFAKALGAYESASADFKKDGGEDKIDECLEALMEIESAAQKLQGEAEKLVKSPPKKTTSTAEDYQNTAEALKKYSKIVEAARKEKEKEKEALAKSAAEDEEGEDEDQEAEGLLNDEPKYKKYLLGAMKKLLKAPMAFAFGLGSKPEEHRFICHKSKKGAALFKTLKSETELTKATFGTAGAHELEAGVLTLALEGKQIGALKKKGELFLKYFKPLPFHTIMLMVDGEIVEDIPDLDDAPPPAASTAPPPAPPLPDSEMARFTARLKTLKPQIDAAITAPDANPEIKLRVSEAAVFARKKEFGPANQMLDQVEALLKPAAAPAPPTTDPNDPATVFKARLAALMPNIKKAIAAGGDFGQEIKARTSEAGVLAQKKDFTEANRLLDEVKQAIEEFEQRGAEQAAKNGSFVVFTQSRLRWDTARKTVHAELENLEQSILKAFNGIDKIPKAKLAELATGAKRLYTILDHLDERLIDKLDEALNAKTPDARATLNTQAAGIVKEYQAFVNSDPLVKNIDGNPFAPVNVQGFLVDTLRDLAARLS